MEAELDHLTLERILSHFASDRGQDLLRAFEQQHLAAKQEEEEAEAHHGALASVAACKERESSSGDDGEFVRHSPVEHVDTVMCGGDDGCDQWEQGRQVRGAGSGCDTDGDVVMGNGMY